MGKSCLKMKKLLILTACAAMAASGCTGSGESKSSQTGLTQNAPDVIVNNVDDHQKEDTIQEQKPPAYVYYIKGGNLMGADVNAELGTDTNPSVIMEGIGEGFSPKSHFYNTQYQAEDGSFRAVNIAGEGDSDNGKLIVICSQDRSSEVIYEGYTYSMMCGSRLLFLVNEIDDNTDETQSDLYSYTPAEGKQLLVSDIYDYRPSEDGSAICFTRADENYDETLYLYKDGEELLLAERMEIAGVDKTCDNIYAQRYVYDEEQEYCELTRIAADGESQEILTKADGVSDYYLNPDHGSVYYFSDREQDDRALYYWSEGENMLISQHLTAVWEYIQDAQWLDGMPMMVYTAEQDGAQRIFAVIGETVSELLTPGFEADWVNDYLMYVTGDNQFYLGVTEADSSYQAVESRIYKYELEGNKLSQSPECVAQGTDISLIKEENGSIFYTDGDYPQSLYYDGKTILNNLYTESVLKTDNDEYFAFRGRISLPPGAFPLKWAWLQAFIQSRSQSLPDLMRITTAGSSKVFVRNIALCEAYAGGLVMLSDCGRSYPHEGTLMFYDGMSLKKIDEDVATFFPQDQDQFVDAVPWSWEWE